MYITTNSIKKNRRTAPPYIHFYLCTHRALTRRRASIYIYHYAACKHTRISLYLSLLYSTHYFARILYLYIEYINTRSRSRSVLGRVHPATARHRLDGAGSPRALARSLARSPHSAARAEQLRSGGGRALRRPG